MTDWTDADVERVAHAICDEEPCEKCPITERGPNGGVRGCMYDAVKRARRVLAALPRPEPSRTAVIEECAMAVENIPPCPFDKYAPPNDFTPDDPCPVCGDLGIFNDKPSNCRSPAAVIRALLQSPENKDHEP